MEFSGFAELAPKVTRVARGAPDILVEENIRDAAIEFCRRTRCWRWRETITAMTADVVLTSFVEYAQIFELETAWVGSGNERALRPVGTNEFEGMAPSTGIPTVICQDRPSTFKVAPAPTDDAPAIISLSLYLEPLRDAQIMPIELIDRFGMDFVAGGLSSTLLIPGHPWSNAALGSYWQMKFNEACERNFAFNLQGQQRAPVRVAASFF